MEQSDNAHDPNDEQSSRRRSSSLKRDSMDSSQKAKPQMIDLDKDDLSYNQAKRIRQQVEKDVELLRNRVRMLQLEEEKAMKKINETKKKTKQILELKQKNDEKYVKQIKEKEISNPKPLTAQQREKQKQDLQGKQFKMYEQKKKEVLQVKMMKQSQQSYKEQLTQEQIQAAQEKKNFIKAQKEIGQFKKEQFQQKKIQQARKEVKAKMNVEKNQIKNYEMEAQQLEMMEAELLRKLQETQMVEKEAFNHLESAMIDASLPKKMRVQANQSQYSDTSGRK